MTIPPLPASASLPARLVRIVLAAVAATPFVVVPGFLYPFVVPRAAWFRLLVAAGVLLLAWLWARDEWRPGPGAWRRERVGTALGAYVAALALAAIPGADLLQGLLGGLVRMGGVVAWLHYLAFFLLLRAVLDGERWPDFLRLTGLVGVAVALWAVLQAYGSGWFGIALFGGGVDQVGGPLGLEGPLAAYMLLTASVAGYLSARAEDRLRRMGWAAVVALELWVVLLTGTRAALVAAAAAVLGLGAWTAVAGRKGSRARRVVIWGVAGAAAVGIGLALLGAGLFPVVERMVDLGPDSLDSRFPLWRAAWAGFLEHPLLGIGPEGFDLVFDRHFRPDDYLAAGAAHHDRAHNVFLGVLAETGVVGVLTYGAFWAAALAAVLWALRRVEREPALVWLAAGVMSYLVYLQLWFEEVSSFHLLLAVLAYLEYRRLRGGGASGTAEAPGDGASGPAERGPSATGSRGRRWAAVGGAMLLAVGVGWYHAQVLGASRETRTAMSVREPLEPFVHLQRALGYRIASVGQITSRYVTALNGVAGLVRRGDAELDSGRVEAVFRRGERAVERELAREPDNSAVRARLASLRAARWRWRGAPEDFRAAVNGYRAALEASPGRVRYLHQLARLHVQRGDPKRAMEVLDEALDRLPGWWETYNTMAQVQWDAGDREEAVRYLLRAARTEVRRKTAGTGTQFMVRAGSWLEARGTPHEAVELYEAYLGARYPGWSDPEGRRFRSVPSAALPIAARLPITLLQAGRTEEAAAAARRLLERLPPHLRRPAVTDRLRRFLDDMEAGRTDRWRQEWGVLPTDVPLEG